MSLKTILFAGIAAVSLASPAVVTSAQASDDTYLCNDQRCHDDQADETRRLNLMQARHPGRGIAAVPGHQNYSYDDDDDDDNGDSHYGDRDDDDYWSDHHYPTYRDDDDDRYDYQGPYDNPWSSDDDDGDDDDD